MSGTTAWLGIPSRSSSEGPRPGRARVADSAGGAEARSEPSGRGSRGSELAGAGGRDGTLRGARASLDLRRVRDPMLRILPQSVPE